MGTGARILTVLAVCGAALAVLSREADRGTFDRFDREFETWLAANSNREFREPHVTFLRLADAAASPGERIFESWPPSALDYAVLAENLRALSPQIVAFAPVLRWSDEDALAGPTLRQALEELDHVVLGTVLENDPAAGRTGTEASDPADPAEPAPADQGPDRIAISEFPALNPDRIAGDVRFLPEFTGVALAPAPELRSLPNTLLGFTEIDLGAGPDAAAEGATVPLLARHAESGAIVPSFALAAALADRGIPASAIRVTIGAAIEFGDGTAIPIDRRGFTLIRDEGREAPVRAPADALLLVGAEFAPPVDPITAAALASLKKNVVVLGLDDAARRVVPLAPDNPVSNAEAAAITIAAIQSGKHVRQLTGQERYAVWIAVAIAAALVAVPRRRSRALGLAALAVMIYLIVALIAFDGYLTWWRASTPLGALAAASLAAIVLAPGTPARDRSAAPSSRS